MGPSERLKGIAETYLQSEGSLAGLSSVLPGWLIEDAIAEHGREGQRNRKLPPVPTVWLVVGMALFPDLSVKNVLRKLVLELGLDVAWGLSEVPHSTSTTKARDRVGWEVLRTMFLKLGSQLSSRQPELDTWKDLPTYALDGSSFTTPDTKENEAGFGRPKTGRGRSAYPQFRGVLLAGAWSHYLLGAKFAAWTVGELTLARSMLDQIPKRSLVLQDRNFYAYAWLSDLAQRDTFFVTRAKKKVVKKVAKKKTSKRRPRLRPKDLQMVQTIEEISRREWIAVLKPSRTVLRQRPDLPSEVPVRLIKCERKGFRPTYVVTNLLDREKYPAEEIAELYWERWEVELGLREIKCVLGSNVDPVFRSKKPDRVRQEVYGLLVAYNCVRALMAEAAEVAGVQPRHLSLTNCLFFASGMFVLMAQADPAELPRHYQILIDQMATCVLPERRKGRYCPREVKVKMSNYKRKQTPAQ